MRRSLTLAGKIFRQPNFGGLLAATFALGMAYSFVVPFMSIWGMQKIGMSAGTFRIFMTVTSLSAIMLSTTLARWSDTHISRRRMLIMGSCGGVLGYCGYAFVEDPVALTIIGSTAIALASVSFSQLFAHVRETFGHSHDADLSLGFLMSLVRVCFSFAWTVGPAIGAWMMAGFGARGVFLGAGALWLLFMVGILRYVPHSPPAGHAHAETHLPVWRVITRGDIFISFAALTLVFGAHATNMMNLPLAVVTMLGGKESDLGIIFAVGPIVEIPLMLWFGHLATRGHQLLLIRLGVLATVGYFLLLSLATQPWHTYPAQVLSGISFAILTNITISFFQDMLPGQRGLATTIFANAHNLGNLLGYFFFGALLEAYGHRGVFLACSFSSAAALVLILLYRHRTVVSVAPATATS